MRHHEAKFRGDQNGLKTAQQRQTKEAESHPQLVGLIAVSAAAVARVFIVGSRQSYCIVSFCKH